MLALYRDGRQAEALETYRAARSRLVDEVGLEPGPELQELERQILAQDPGLLLDRPRPAPCRAILVLPAGDATIDALVDLAETLAARGAHELVIAALVDDDTQVAAAAARLTAVRAGAGERGVTARTAAFSSPDRAADAVRLANDEDVALLLLDAPDELLQQGSPDGLVAGVLAHAVCDVALVAGAQRGTAAADAPVLVPFGGHQHDWAAVELGAWIASASGARCDSWAPARIRARAAVTRAGCSAARRSRYSTRSASRPNPCSSSPGPTRSSKRPTGRRS